MCAFPFEYFILPNHPSTLSSFSHQFMCFCNSAVQKPSKDYNFILLLNESARLKHSEVVGVTIFKWMPWPNKGFFQALYWRWNEIQYQITEPVPYTSQWLCFLKFLLAKSYSEAVGFFIAFCNQSKAFQSCLLLGKQNAFHTGELCYLFLCYIFLEKFFFRMGELRCNGKIKG